MLTPSLRVAKNIMGSRTASRWDTGLGGSRRTVVVGSNERNVSMMAETLAEHNVVVATEPGDLNPVLSGSLDAGLVVVDADLVTDDIRALVGSLLDRDLQVLLLANDASPEVRERATATDGLTFREKPVRAGDLRTFVSDAFDS